MQFLQKLIKQNPLFNMFVGVMLLTAILYIIFRPGSFSTDVVINGTNVVQQSVQDLSQLRNDSPLLVGDVIIEVSPADTIILTFNSDTYDENLYGAYSILKQYGIAPDDGRIVEIVN